MTDRSPTHTEQITRLFDDHGTGLAGAVRAVLGPGGHPEEVLQDAWLKACEALRRGPAPADPAGWLFVLTLNLARDRRRKERRRNRHHSEDADMTEIASPAPGPLETAGHRETLAAARSAVFRLDDPEKDVFLLRVSGGLSFAAAAASLGIPEGTAKTRMRTALRKLRAALQCPDRSQQEEQTRRRTVR